MFSSVPVSQSMLRGRLFAGAHRGFLEKEMENGGARVATSYVPLATR
jgi:hypothetical protein